MQSSNKPLYIQIIDYLKEEINKDEFALNQQLPTEKDLAEKFNVSRITSKRAMEELEREGLIVRKRGSGSFLLHKKNSINNKTNDEKNKMNVVALIIPFGGSLGRGMDLIQGLSEVLNKNSFFLTVHISNQDSDEERRIIINLVDSGVRGIILYPVSHRKNIDLISRLLLDNYPIITIDKYYEAFPLSCVLSDNFSGSYKAASHLIELGHKEIVFVTDSDLDSATSVKDRYFGFSKAIKDNGLTLNDENMICINHLNNETLNCIKEYDSLDEKILEPFIKIIEYLISKERKCTAIHAVHDYLAIFLLKSARIMGINVPNDLSIVGFDNIENASYLEVTLTTVEQNFSRIGEEAGNLILKIIKTGIDEHKSIILPVELLVRNSTISTD